MRSLILICVLCLIQKQAFTQGKNLSDSTTIFNALHSIYNFNFENYKPHQARLKKSDKYLIQLMDIFYLRWKDVPIAFSSEKDSYRNLLQKNISDLEQEKIVSPEIAYYKISNYLFLSEYYSSLGENWAALKYAQKAYPLIINGFNSSNSQIEFLFIMGLYQYYIEHYKQKSFFYKAILLPLRSGNKEEGLRLLKKCTEKESIVKVEAQIYLAHIYLHLENKPFIALPISKSLVTEFPDNIKFKELYTDNLLRCKMYEVALPLIDQLINQKSLYYSRPGYFFRGIVEDEYLKDKTKARLAYEKCIKGDYRPTEIYQKMAEQRLKKL